MEYHKVTREDLRRLARAQVVTTQELAELFQRSPTRAAKLAFDLRKRGLLTEVRRGVYASIPLEADPRNFRPDPFLTACRAMGERYAFSHRSALTLLGGEQTVRASVEMTAPGVRPRRRQVGHVRVHLYCTPRDGWGRAQTTVRRGGTTLRVTTPERTLVDLAALPNSQQDYEEDLLAFRALMPRVNPKKLLREVMSRRSARVRSRVGHLLQSSGTEEAGLTDVLRAIQGSVSRSSPSYFATQPHAASNRFDPTFRVVYPGQR